MEVLDCLFVDVISGKDILQKHKQITLKFNGSKDELIVGGVKSNDFAFACQDMTTKTVIQCYNNLFTLVYFLCLMAYQPL